MLPDWLEPSGDYPHGGKRRMQKCKEQVRAKKGDARARQLSRPRPDCRAKTSYQTRLWSRRPQRKEGDKGCPPPEIPREVEDARRYRN